MVISIIPPFVACVGSSPIHFQFSISLTCMATLRKKKYQLMVHQIKMYLIFNRECRLLWELRKNQVKKDSLAYIRLIYEGVAKQSLNGLMVIHFQVLNGKKLICVNQVIYLSTKMKKYSMNMKKVLS